jgi:iron(III) transport system substrate-binding protein
LILWLTDVEEDRLVVAYSPKKGRARRLMIVSLTAVAVAAFVGATATAKGKPKPATMFITPSGPAVPKLIAASKKEDGLIIYGNPPAALWGPVLAAFNKLYPWIKVTPYDQGDAAAFSKYTAERASGVRTADLVVASAPNLWVYASRTKLALDFTPFGLSAFPSFAKQYKGVYVMSPDPAIMLYNKLVLKDPSQVPTGIDDLAKKAAADPSKYKSIAYIVENGFGYGAYWGYVQGRGWSNLRALAPSTRVTESAATMAQTVAQGGATVSYLTSGAVRGNIRSSPQTSAVLGWTYEHDTTPLIPRGIAITAGTHSPSSAKLFLDFIFSRVGQQALCDGGFTSYMNNFVPQNCEYSLQALYDAVGKSHVQFVPFSQTFVNAKPAFSSTWHRYYH